MSVRVLRERVAEESCWRAVLLRRRAKARHAAGRHADGTDGWRERSTFAGRGGGLERKEADAPSPSNVGMQVFVKYFEKVALALLNGGDDRSNAGPLSSDKILKNNFKFIDFSRPIEGSRRSCTSGAQICLTQSSCDSYR